MQTFYMKAIPFPSCDRSCQCFDKNITKNKLFFSVQFVSPKLASYVAIPTFCTFTENISEIDMSAGADKRTVSDNAATIAVSCPTLFNLQKQKEEKEFCDVVLQVDDQEYAAHRNVLAASSEYFLKMFTVDMKEKSSKHVPIKNVTSLAMSEILKAVYQQKISLTSESLGDIIHAASMMQISSVLDAASLYINHVIHLENCFWLQQLVSKYSHEKLIKAVQTFFLKNIEKVFLRKEFLELDFKVLDPILASDDLIVDEEKTVFEMLLMWTNHDFKKRNRYFPMLFKHVRLQFIPINYVIDTIRKNHIVKQFHKCRDLLDDVTSYHINPTIFAAQKHRNCFVPKPDSIMLVPYEEYFQAVYNFENATWNKFLFEGLSNGTVWKNCAVAVQYPISFFCGGQRGDLSLKQVVRFDGIRWVTLPSMSVARCGAAAVVFKDKLFVFGGEMKPVVKQSQWYSETENPVKSKFANTYETFDSSWNAKINDLVSRSHFAAQVVGEKIYLMGGFVATPARSGCYHSYACQKSHDTVIFCPRTNVWTRGGKLHTARASFASVVLNSKIYVFGNCNIYNSSTLGLEILNSEENIWTIVYNDQNFGSMIACTLDDKVGYAVNGEKLLQYEIAKQAESQKSWSLLNSKVPGNGVLIPYSQRYHTYPITNVKQFS